MTTSIKINGKKPFLSDDKMPRYQIEFYFQDGENFGQISILLNVQSWYRHFVLEKKAGMVFLLKIGREVINSYQDPKLSDEKG